MTAIATVSLRDLRLCGLWEHRWITLWADMKGDATFLPAQRPVDIETLAHVMPGLVITAYGKDQTRGIYRPVRREIAVRVGYVTWIVTDNRAYDSMANAWD